MRFRIWAKFKLVFVFCECVASAYRFKFLEFSYRPFMSVFIIFTLFLLIFTLFLLIFTLFLLIFIIFIIFTIFTIISKKHFLTDEVSSLSLLLYTTYSHYKKFFLFIVFYKLKIFNNLNCVLTQIKTKTNFYFISAVVPEVLIKQQTSEITNYQLN